MVSAYTFQNPCDKYTHTLLCDSFFGNKNELKATFGINMGGAVVQEKHLWNFDHNINISLLAAIK